MQLSHACLFRKCLAFIIIPMLRDNFHDIYEICSFQFNLLSIHDDVIKWKHFPRYWPYVRGIHWSPVNSPHKGQWRRALMFSLICAWINGGINNGEAGDLRRHRPIMTLLMITPRNVVFLTSLIACSSITILILSSHIFFLLKIIKWGFFLFSVIVYWPWAMTRCLTTWFSITLKSFQLENILVFANKIGWVGIFTNGTQSYINYIKNSIGPKIELWGTSCSEICRHKIINWGARALTKHFHDIIMIIYPKYFP